MAILQSFLALGPCDVEGVCRSPSCVNTVRQGRTQVQLNWTRESRVTVYLEELKYTPGCIIALTQQL